MTKENVSHKISYLIDGFSAHLSAINERRAEKGDRIILDKEGGWSAFLSTGGNKVKQYWVRQLKTGSGIANGDALVTLAGLNARLIEHGLKPLEPKKTIVEK